MYFCMPHSKVLFIAFLMFYKKPDGGNFYMLNVKEVKLGKTSRMSFAKIEEQLEAPDLIEVQKNSYNWFITDGLKEVFEELEPVTDYSGNLILEFIDFTLEKKPKYTIEECKERDLTYSAPLRVKVRFINKETNEIKEQGIFICDMPLMTDSGTFIINGAERVIVSQLVRSSGIYYAFTHDKTGKKLFTCTVIPNRGAWLEYETDSSDNVFVRIDKNRKLSIVALIKALGLVEHREILEYFGDNNLLQIALEKDTIKTQYLILRICFLTQGVTILQK